MEKTWRHALAKEIQQPYVEMLKKFLMHEMHNEEIYPPASQIFEAFRLTPYNKVRVVILGQDPYHGPGQAHGLCFSVNKGIPIPPSLKNIYRELHDDITTFIPSNHGDLHSWAMQGILLLNAVLTVRKGEPRSHCQKGWEIFTDSVIRLLAFRDLPVVFLLWGSLAQEKYHRIFAHHNVSHKHCVLQAGHPSPLSSSRFFGCKHFSQTNAFLQRINQKPINWNIPQ